LINDPILGYFKVGIIVLTILKSEYFSMLEFGNMNLVFWDILAMRECKTGTFLKDHVQKAPHDPEDLDKFEASLIPKNQIYQQTKRTKVDPKEKEERNQLAKAKKRLL
jgi:hypothetical protein